MDARTRRGWGRGGERLGRLGNEETGITGGHSTESNVSGGGVEPRQNNGLGVHEYCNYEMYIFFYEWDLFSGWGRKGDAQKHT